MKYKILVVAGGTGGHIIPACNLLENLYKDNAISSYNPILITDKKFNNYCIHKNKIKNIKYLDIYSRQTGIFKYCSSIFIQTIKMIIFILRNKVKLVIGFGGYSSFPTLLAAFILRKKIILHDSNSKIGKVNKLFSKYATYLCTMYPFNNNYKNFLRIGTPIDNNFSSTIYLLLKEKFVIYVTGGSQGARFFKNIIPDVILKLSHHKKIKIIHQCRVNEEEYLKDKYASMNIDHEVSSFFSNVLEIMKESHLIITRAGAGTIAEIATIGRPAIYIPLPSASDNHQYYNAKYIDDSNAGILVEEKDFNIDLFVEKIILLIGDDKKLLSISENIKSLFKNEDCSNQFIKIIKESLF